MSLARKVPLPNGGNTSDNVDDVSLDIDRWENDGGRSVRTKHYL